MTDSSLGKPPRDAQSVRVHLATNDAEQRARWQASLRGHGFDLTIQADHPSRLAAADAVLADAVLADVVLADGRAWDSIEQLEGEPFMRSEPQVVWIGGDLEAEVVLPSDCLPRELRLACRLQGLLRRKQRAARANRLAANRWARRALSDPLTGLANRRAWQTELRRQCRAVCSKIQVAPEQSISPEQSMGPEQLGPVMVLLDIDRFKTVNQRWGHAVGDDVLCRVAHALAANLRSGDYLARLGGDEFGVLFASRDERSASARMEELRRAARVDQGQHAVTASAGCGLIGGFSLGDPEKGEPEKGEREQQNQDTSVAGAAPLGPRQIAHQLYSAAVEALREAKQRGRDRGALRRAL